MTPGVLTTRQPIIRRNRHPAGRLGTMLLGLAQVADGVVRIVSLGHLHTTLPIAVTRMRSRMAINALKKDLKNV